MTDKKNIWIPKSETKVILDQEGNLSVWDEMVMELKPISPPKGFGTKPEK